MQKHSENIEPLYFPKHTNTQIHDYFYDIFSVICYHIYHTSDNAEMNLEGENRIRKVALDSKL